MSPIRTDLRGIALISGVLFLLGFSAALLAFGMDAEMIGKCALKSGAILTVIGLFWAWFNRWGWHIQPFRYALPARHPDLDGRWEGTVCRNKYDAPHDFVLEVTQTFTTFSYRSFTKHSRGECVSAGIFSDETGEVFKVFTSWRCTTRDLADRTREESFMGCSEWHISLDGKTKRLSDKYFTSREPQTKGVLDLVWKSRRKLNRFN